MCGAAMPVSPTGMPWPRSGRCFASCTPAAGRGNAACRMQNAECRMQNAECRMRNAACRMRNAECGMQNAECRMRNAERGGWGGVCSARHLTHRSLAASQACARAGRRGRAAHWGPGAEPLARGGPGGAGGGPSWAGARGGSARKRDLGFHHEPGRGAAAPANGIWGSTTSRGAGRQRPQTGSGVPPRDPEPGRGAPAPANGIWGSPQDPGGVRGGSARKRGLG
jgi:hypothetical protein